GASDIFGCIHREIHYRAVFTGNDEDWKTCGDFLNDIDLPISQQGVDWPGPIAAEPLSFPERKVIDDTGGETMVELDLRERPIGLRRSRQRIICGTSASAQATGEAATKSAPVSVTKESVKAMPHILGLGFHLKGIIASRTNVIDVLDITELWVA